MGNSEDEPGRLKKGGPSEPLRVYDPQDPLTIWLEELTPEQRKELSRRLDEEQEDRIGNARLLDRYRRTQSRIPETEQDQIATERLPERDRSTQRKSLELSSARSTGAPPIFRKTDKGWVLNTAPPPPIIHKIKAGLLEAFWFVVGSILLGISLWAAYTSVKNITVALAVLVLVFLFWIGSKRN